MLESIREAKSNPKFWANHRSLQPAVNSTAEKTQDCSQPSLPQESSQYLPWNLGNNHATIILVQSKENKDIQKQIILCILSVLISCFSLTRWQYDINVFLASSNIKLCSPTHNSNNISYGVFRREIGILLPSFTFYWEDQIGKFFSHEIISTAGVYCQPTYSGGTVPLCRDQVAQLTSENPQQLTHQRASEDI